MGILSEIFAELNAALLPTSTNATKGDNTPYSMDPFAGNQKKPAAKTVAKSAPKNVPISEQKTALEMHAHKHPARVDSRVEKRPAYAGSLGNMKSEGCDEHADERYISSSQPIISARTISASEMRKAVIMSEIIGKPKCKR